MNNLNKIKQIQQLQKIAGILKEDDDFNLFDNPLKPDKRILVYTHGNGDFDYYGDQYNAEEVSQIISTAYSSGDEEVKITKITNDFYLVEIDGGIFTYSVIGPKFQYAKKIFSLVDDGHELAAEEEIINFLRRAKHLEEDDDFDLSDNPLKPDKRVLVYSHGNQELDYYGDEYYNAEQVAKIYQDFFNKNGYQYRIEKITDDFYNIEESYTIGSQNTTLTFNSSNVNKGHIYSFIGAKAPNAKQIFSLVDAQYEIPAEEEIKKVLHRYQG